MAQQRNGIVFFEDSERHLKLVGKLYDQVKLLNIVHINLILHTGGRPLICHYDEDEEKRWCFCEKTRHSLVFPWSILT